MSSGSSMLTGRFIQTTSCRPVDAIHSGADLAIGSRKLPASVILQPQPPIRRILGSAYAALARSLLQTTERDLQCGCKAFRRSLWDALSVNCDGFAFDTELVAKAHKKGFAIAEVPITWRNKADSKVKVRRDVSPCSGVCCRCEIRRSTPSSCTPLSKLSFC